MDYLCPNDPESSSRVPHIRVVHERNKLLGVAKWYQRQARARDWVVKVRIRYETNFMVFAEQMSGDFNKGKYIAGRANSCDDEVLFHVFTNLFTSSVVDRAART